MPVLHVVVPHFNESATLDAALDGLAAVAWPAGWRAEVTVVDDGSDADASRRAAETCARRGVGFVRHERNRGKGAAIRTGFARVLERASEDDAVAIQDADLEYDPSDLVGLLRALPDRDIVFGNRWAAAPDPRLKRRIHRFLNACLTRSSNALTGLNVADMECCYKLFTVPALRTVLPELTEERFGIEPQIAAVAARRGLRVAEAPVRYRPRGFAEGKKIRPKDGVRALVVMLRERLRGGAR